MGEHHAGFSTSEERDGVRVERGEGGERADGVPFAATVNEPSDAHAPIMHARHVPASAFTEA